MNEFKFTCPHCGQRLEADESFYGQELECPSCSKTIIAPVQGNQVASAVVVSSMHRDSEVVASMYRDSEMGEIRCPYCKVASPIWETKIGKRVTCRNCRKEFEVGEGFTIKSQDLNQKNNILTSIMNLADKLYRKMYWRSYTVLCPKCNTKSEECGPRKVDSRNIRAIFLCSKCRLYFYLHDGICRYNNQLIDAIDKELYLAILKLNLIIFENDWAMYQDPVICERLKFMIDALRARLSSVNIEKIVNAQRSAAAAIVGYGTTVGLRNPQSIMDGIGRAVVQIGAYAKLASSENRQSAIYNTASDLEEELMLHEEMVHHYYDLKQEFYGKQKDEAREQRLLASCNFLIQGSLPESISTLPDDAEELQELVNGTLHLQKNIKIRRYDIGILNQYLSEMTH